MPALFALEAQHLLPRRFRVLGVGRTPFTTEEFRGRMAEGIRRFSDGPAPAEAETVRFLEKADYLAMDMEQASSYAGLKSRLVEEDAAAGSGGNHLFYLATPPVLFGAIAGHLAAVRLNGKKESRLVVEKPFGYDLESALRLTRQLQEAFSEEQIYRIDHYLGKETVQNLLVLRFANGIFEPLWNRQYVERVEITAAENLGVEGRGGYYDRSGALRDMLQNHLLQMTGLVAMEPPSSPAAGALRDETVRVLQSLKPLGEQEVDRQVIRGQYVASHVRGEAVAGYREEKGVDPASRTETYVAMKFFIDTPRWQGVPFFIRTGKRLPTRVTEVVIHFRPVPQNLFRHEGFCPGCNQLIIRIQPDEGILLKFGLKQPGAGFRVKTVPMDFHYRDLADIRLPSAYERLICDAMAGDPTLFARADAVEAAWRFVAPVQQFWAAHPGRKIHGYPAGTWGPEHADILMDHGNGWRYPCKNLADDGEYCEL